MDAILWLAEQIGAGMIVLGSRGLGRLIRLPLESVADGVVHRAHCTI
ncbi:MAG: universal stress protein [Rubrobacter sp.]|nr:universal stress protein [Rubrobacter sp.]